MVNPQAYNRRTAAQTPEQRKTDKIARLEALQARAEKAMRDPDAANAPAKWWELMTKRHIRRGMEINMLKGRSAYDFAD
tara:strand:+ start:656 stop:892 length:237 start_codon:yes stop_codon:yes gene_type:complete